MEVTLEALNTAFAASSPEDQALFEFDGPSDSYSGYLIRADFRGQITSERQKRIWSTLREKFGENSQEVSLILAFSPEEWEEIQEDMATAS